ncbi:MAG: 30S ribosomal protein S20 [Candidatus Moranbacteria bacterium]|nr:30S ribosomal protein S20 [Candidatus Moranbacteria bacterium]
MPIKKSARKYMQSSQKKEVKNKTVKDDMKKAIKKAKEVIEAEKKDLKKIKERLAKAQKIIDKAVQKKVIKKNTGARKKSQLFKNNKQK